MSLLERFECIRLIVERTRLQIQQATSVDEQLTDYAEAINDIENVIIGKEFEH